MPSIHTIKDTTSRFRIISVGLFGLALLCVLSLRLVHVQGMLGDQYAREADDNRFHTTSLQAERGVLFDRRGQSLVRNLTRYAYRLNPDGLYSAEQPIGRDEGLERLATQAGQVEISFNREYVAGSALAHLIGYVGTVTKEDLLARSYLRGDDLVGRGGLEKVLDEQLQGIDGEQVWETNALGQRLRVLHTTPSRSGMSFRTTLDSELAAEIVKALDGVKGAVVVSDASSGAVLASVSAPSFDPRMFTPVEDVEAEKSRKAQLSQALTDPRQLFFNRALVGEYPPGSLFKIVTALSGLEKGSLTGSTEVLDEGVLRVAGYEYRNWFYRQRGGTDGLLTVSRALARSNDIFFYKTAEMAGPQAIAEMARRIGLGVGVRSDFGLTGSGLIPDPAWKERVIGEPWYLGNTYHMGIGQGDVLVTPLQMAELGQVVANQGVWCQPHVLEQTTLECRDLGLQPANLELVTRGLFGACSPGGTAGVFFPRNTARLGPDFSIDGGWQSGGVACKTGTAEFGAANEKGARNTHGWFLSMGEPKYVRSGTWPRRVVMAVIVESDETAPFREGSREAAQVARKIWDWWEVSEASGSAEVVASSSATVQ